MTNSDLTIKSILPPGTERKKRTYTKRKPLADHPFQVEQDAKANQAMSTIYANC